MTRDRLRDRAYFDSGIRFKQQAIDEDRSTIAHVSGDEARAMCVLDLWQYAVKLVIQRYGRGDALLELLDSVVQDATSSS